MQHSPLQLYQMVPLELLSVMSKNPFRPQGSGMVNMIMLLLALILHTHAQKGLLHIYM
jgi:hypothetical protein